MNNLGQLLKFLEKEPVRKVCVAVAEDITVLQAMEQAIKVSVAEPVLIGNEVAIRKIAKKNGISLKHVEIVNEPDELQAAARAVQLMSEGQADILMKGHIHTDDFLRAILNREAGFRTGVLMSHIFIVEVPAMDKLIFVTDGAMNIAPDLEQKAQILLNAVHLAKVFGVMQPKVAVLTAVELVNPQMPATIDAACLAKISDRHQFVPHCIVDGPFALDNAISEFAATHKKITGPVAGKADILLVPTIESGNMLVKSMVYFGKCRLAGLLVGAKAPVVLTSRADTAESKFLSIAAGTFMINIKRALRLKVGKMHY